MDKTLQDLAWSMLPKEFKEEVKNMWSVKGDCATKYKSELHKHRTGLLYELFGDHLYWQNNLTSDAEGEEMLTVSRKRVREMYAANERIKADSPDKGTAHISDHINHVLKHLFGSKCLPDNVESSEPNVDSLPQNPTDFGKEVNFPTKNNLAIYLKKSKNCDKQFGDILKGSFLKERRLNIATQILSGIVASDKPYRHPVKRAIELADALITECEKKG